jgi:hypothetical protein
MLSSIMPRHHKFRALLNTIFSKAKSESETAIKQIAAGGRRLLPFKSQF